MTKTHLPTAPLSTFTPHDGELEVVEVHDSDGNVKRMCELGICPGKHVTIVRQGDPAILTVGDSRFALSGELLTRVYVRPVS
ncbi:MAG: ferrous iron transport protein A [Planctomycetes bacterium]|nr:ferrous iron transport protein A [Planctomycetota bacterium]